MQELLLHKVAPSQPKKNLDLPAVVFLSSGIGNFAFWFLMGKKDLKVLRILQKCMPCRLKKLICTDRGQRSDNEPGSQTQGSCVPANLCATAPMQLW